MVDFEKKEYRDSTVQDLYHAAQITQELDNIHFFQRVMVGRDITDNYEMDLQYALRLLRRHYKAYWN